MKIYLETERLILREFTPQDKTFLFDLDSSSNVMKYISNGIPSTEAEISRAIDVMLSYQEKFSNKLGYWVAIERTNLDLVGWFHLRPEKDDPDNTQKLELGYRLKERFWGKGFATEGSIALIEKAFNELDAKTITAHTMKNNIGSQNVMKKCGMSFSHNGRYEEFPGDDKDTVWFKLDKDS